MVLITKKNLDKSLKIFISIILAIFLHLCSLYNYLLFHSIAEGFIIVIAICIFLIAWNSRRITDNDYFTFLSIAFLFIGGIEFLHMLGYPGMNIFIGYGTNLATQLWILVRYLESISFLIATILLGKRIQNRKRFSYLVIILYFMISSFFVISIFLGFFPDCFVEGSGLTIFKIVSEYIIIAILFASIISIINKKENLDRDVFQLIIFSLLITIGAEFCFTLYENDPYGLFNQLGHYLTILSFYFIYRALIVTSLHGTFKVLFKDLKKSKELLETTFASLDTAIFILDNKLPPTFLDFNKAACDIFGHSRDEMLGKTTKMKMISKEHHEEFLNKIVKMVEKWNYASFEFEMKRKDGQSFPVDFYISPLLDDNRNQFGWVTAIKDITDRKDAENDLLLINQELKDFCSIVAHDLKAPLRNIINLVKWLLRDSADDLSEEGKDNLNLMVKQTTHMNALIDGIHQYSKIDRVHKNITQINLNELLSEVIEVLSPPENIEITIQTALPVLAVDRTHMIQIFSNLLDNAVKFIDKPKGHIIISCEEKQNYWRFSVADNGPGIEERHFERIFQIFQTLTPIDEAKGTGIGLAIVKKVVEMNGGILWLESTVGEGSTFYFTLQKV